MADRKKVKERTFRLDLDCGHTAFVDQGNARRRTISCQGCGGRSERVVRRREVKRDG